MEGVKGEVAQAKWSIKVKGPKIQANGLDLTSFGGTNQGSHWLVNLLKCGVSACRSLLRIQGRAASMQPRGNPKCGDIGQIVASARFTPTPMKKSRTLTHFNTSRSCFMSTVQ